MSTSVRRSIRCAATAVWLVVTVAACGGTGASGSADGASEPAATSTASAAMASPGATLAVDQGLLGVLPARIDGNAPVALPVSDVARSAADPALTPLASALALAYVASPTKEDWASVAILALRPGALDEAGERAWRDSYDRGACASAGGPAGHAETALDGRTVYITTCGGLVVHHVRLAAPDRIIAITSAGAGRYGERIVAGLRP